MVSLMQSEGETDNWKAMIMVSFNDFTMFIFRLFRQFTTQLYTHTQLVDGLPIAE